MLTGLRCRSCTSWLAPSASALGPWHQPTQLCVVGHKDRLGPGDSVVECAHQYFWKYDGKSVLPRESH